MDITLLTQYLNLVIVGICLCVGCIIKNSTPIENRYIPAIMGCLGLALALITNYHDITLETVLMGLMSGLSSTGLYEAFKNLIGASNE